MPLGTPLPPPQKKESTELLEFLVTYELVSHFKLSKLLVA